MPPDAAPSRLPLAGIKVIEIAQNLAGPYAAQILGHLGADVIKVERPEGGDDARFWGEQLAGHAGYSFHAVNTNKRGITVDLTDPGAIAWLRGLIAGADVLIQNLRPGVMDELGLDAVSLRAANPRLVYCSLWAYGNTGPLRLKPGYEPIVQAFAGIFAVNGAPDSPPSRVGVQVLDFGTGMWAAMGCLAALQQRHVTGEGCVVDTSLLETALGWLNLPLGTFLSTGRQPQRHRSGAELLMVFRAFETSDGEIMVATANDRLWAKLAQAIGRPQWASDARFATNAQRLVHKDTLIPELEALMRTRSRAEWREKLEAAGVPCGPINSVAEAAREPQVAATGMLQPIDDKGLTVTRLPISFDGARPPIRRPAPRLGEHDAETGAPKRAGEKSAGKPKSKR
jgi:crotonobetainyl-CoA:carnitine CoA-transferase CaiB-like acyl-CoA transferase